MRARTSLISLLALFSLASVSMFGAHVKGMINNRTGETFTVASGNENVDRSLTEALPRRMRPAVWALRN